jgi:hypothetical protein
MGLDDIWDNILDGLAYAFSFEWISDLWEFISAGFEDIGELSVYGLVMGTLSLLFTYATRSINVFGGKKLGLIESMTQYMKPTSRVMWTVICYVGVFIAGYLLGKMFENTD